VTLFTKQVPISCSASQNSAHIHQLIIGIQYRLKVPRIVADTKL
jgi:hypothetical protein